MRAALVALVLAALFVAGRARADEAPCTAMVHDWVGRAASAGHTRMIAVACAPERVRVRLEPNGAEPYEVEVAEGPGPAFRRVGRFRLSPLLVVNDWRTLPAPQRDAFDALSGWIDAHEGDVRFVAGRIPTPARAVLRPFGVRTRYAWMVVVALLLVFATRLRAPPIAREDRIACGAFFVAAFALRVALGGAPRGGAGVDPHRRERVVLPRHRRAVCRRCRVPPRRGGCVVRAQTIARGPCARVRLRNGGWPPRRAGVAHPSDRMERSRARTARCGCLAAHDEDPRAVPLRGCRVRGDRAPRARHQRLATARGVEQPHFG